MKREALRVTGAVALCEASGQQEVGEMEVVERRQLTTGLVCEHTNLGLGTRGRAGSGNNQTGD